VAGEFKRAGFLEGEAIETPPPIGHQTQLRVAWWWRSAAREWLGAELAMGRTMTSQKTCRLGAPRLTIAPRRESQDPTVTFGGLGLVWAQADKPKCQVFGQR